MNRNYTWPHLIKEMYPKYTCNSRVEMSIGNKHVFWWDTVYFFAFRNLLTKHLHQVWGNVKRFYRSFLFNSLEICFFYIKYTYYLKPQSTFVFCTTIRRLPTAFYDVCDFFSNLAATDRCREIVRQRNLITYKFFICH